MPPVTLNPGRPIGESPNNFLLRVSTSGAGLPLIDWRPQYLAILAQLEAIYPPQTGEPIDMENGFGLCSRASSAAGHLDYGIRHDHSVFWNGQGGWGVPDLPTMRRRATIAFRNTIRRPILYTNAPYRHGTYYTNCGRPSKYYVYNQTTGQLDYHEDWTGPPYVAGTIPSTPQEIMDNGNPNDNEFGGNQIDNTGCWWTGFDTEHIPIGICVSLAEMGTSGHAADWTVPMGATTFMASDLGKTCVYFNSNQAAGIVRRFYLPITGVTTTATNEEPGPPRFMAKYARLTARAAKLGVLQANGGSADTDDAIAFADYLTRTALPFCEKTKNGLPYANAIGIRSTGPNLAPHPGVLPGVWYPPSSGVTVKAAGHPSGLWPWPKMGWYMVQLNEVAEVVEYWPEAADMLIAFGGPGVAIGNRMRDVVRRYAGILVDATNDAPGLLNGTNHATIGEAPYQLSFSPGAWATLAGSGTPLATLSGLVEGVDYQRHWSAYSALTVAMNEWKQWDYTAFRIAQNYPASGGIPTAGQQTKAQTIANGILAWWQALGQQYEGWNGGVGSTIPHGAFPYWTYNQYQFMVEYGTAGFAGAYDGAYSFHPVYPNS